MVDAVLVGACRWIAQAEIPGVIEVQIDNLIWNPVLSWIDHAVGIVIAVDFAGDLAIMEDHPRQIVAMIGAPYGAQTLAGKNGVDASRVAGDNHRLGAECDAERGSSEGIV